MGSENNRLDVNTQAIQEMISEMQTETQVIQLLRDLNDEFYQREVQTALMHHDECKRLLDEIRKRDRIINKLLVRRKV